ncbi:MAG: inositol-3-phosphate synthase [Spirochaetales bacterium]|jgi:myo-inositol-1-phosphate synthase|nr:inositol-3-phosphate synthase [Spirochaetales bacterium]
MPNEEIRVAVAGIGCCTSHLVQGIYKYHDVENNDEWIPGLMHPVLGGYKIRDIKYVAAFDIDNNKIGKDLSEAIFAPPNNMTIFADVPSQDVQVKMGPILDGAPDHLRKYYDTSDETEPCDVVKELKDSGAQVFVNFIPTGSGEAAKFYADCAIEAGCAFVNCMPEFLSSNQKYVELAKAAKVPLIGDDIKSQVGATILHRVLAQLCVDRGVKINKTSQLNFAGNTDFVNLVKRGETKEFSKQSSVESLIPYETEVSVGFGYIGLQKDQKICRLYIEGENFGGNPIEIRLECSIEDSANAAGCIIDAIRYAKIGLDRGIGGPLYSASSYLMKHPPKKVADSEAIANCEKFIKGEIDW